MAHKINDLTLGSQSAFTRVQDAPREVSLALALTASERRALEEMAAYAGRVTESALPGGGILVRDESPNGENLAYITPDSTASTLMDEGWFAWMDFADDWNGSTTVNRAQATLKRVANPNDAVGKTTSVTEFLSHDY